MSDDDDQLPPETERLIERMDPNRNVREAIRAHLLRQRGVAAGRIRLDDGTVVDEGEEPEE